MPTKLSRMGRLSTFILDLDPLLTDIGPPEPTELMRSVVEVMIWYFFLLAQSRVSNSTSVSRRCSSGGGSYHCHGHSTFPRLRQVEVASHWELHYALEVSLTQ